MQSWTGTQESDIIDCSTINISYQVNGLATISFTLYRRKGSGAPYGHGSATLDLRAGGVVFRGWVTSVQSNPNTEAEAEEYKITAWGLGH